MISEEDKLLFKKSFDNLKEKDIETEKFANKDDYANNYEEKIFLDYSYINNANISASESISYHTSASSKKIMQKMKKGNVGNIPQIDLHGHNIKESCISLSKFIHYHQQKEIIHIIHGKGYHCKKNLSILKSQIVHYLKEHPQVLSFCSCPQKYGGTGAVFVNLKNNV